MKTGLLLPAAEPALQVHTGDCIDGRNLGGQGVVYRPSDGAPLETVRLFDGVHRPEFATRLLRPCEIFRSTTPFRFTRRGRL